MTSATQAPLVPLIRRWEAFSGGGECNLPSSARIRCLALSGGGGGGGGSGGVRATIILCSPRLSKWEKEIGNCLGQEMNRGHNQKTVCVVADEPRCAEPPHRLSAKQ